MVCGVDSTFLYFCEQDLYCVRSDLGNLLKALGRLEEAKVHYQFSGKQKGKISYSRQSFWS